MILRDLVFQGITPLDDEDTVSGHVHCLEVLEFVHRPEPIDVDMDQRQEATPVLADQDKGRAEHLLLDAQTGSKPGGEQRLADAKAAGEEDYVPGAQSGGQLS